MAEKARTEAELAERRIRLLMHYLRCYVTSAPTGDAEFDAAYEDYDHAKIILDRLNAAKQSH